MDVEQVVNQLGGFGKYQLLITSLAYFTVIFCSQHVVQDSFINYTPDHRCFVPSCDSDTSTYDEEFLNFTTPFEDNSWARCNYRPKLTNTSSDGTKTKRRLATGRHGAYKESFEQVQNVRLDKSDIECTEENFDDETTMKCDKGWIYDHEIFEKTTTTEFDLTCSKAYITGLTTTTYSFGMFLGALSMGVLADKLGRKVAFLVSVGLTLAGGVAGALSVSPLMLILARVPTGIGAVGLFECAFILSIEFMPVKHRSTVGLLINVLFALGEALVGVYAIFIRRWRALQLTIVLPSAILGLYYWFLPESLRWLVSKGKQKEALELVTKIAKFNGVEVPDCSFMEKGSAENEEAATSKKRSAFDLLRTPIMRKRTLNMFFIWIVVNLVYYGVSQNAVHLGGDIFVNFIGMMLIEIPSYFLTALVFDRIGHKGTLAATLLLAGVACTATGFVSKDAETTIVVLSLIGKFGAAAAFSIIYVYASEIFPTEYRSIGVGSCSMCARFGGMAAPLVAFLGEDYPALPLLIFGFISCISVISVLFLPETVGCALPQTLEESEEFGSDQSIWYFSFCSSRGRRNSRTVMSKSPANHESDSVLQVDSI